MQCLCPAQSQIPHYAKTFRQWDLESTLDMPSRPARIRTWISKASGLQEDMIKRSLALHEFFHGCDARVLDTAAQAAIGELKKFFGFLCERIVGGGDVDCSRWMDE